MVYADSHSATYQISEVRETIIHHATQSAGQIGIVELKIFLPKTLSGSQKQILYEPFDEMTTVPFRIIGNKLQSYRPSVGKNFSLVEAPDFFILYLSLCQDTLNDR
jgi:hypothetical protein